MEEGNLALISRHTGLERRSHWAPGLAFLQRLDHSATDQYHVGQFHRCQARNPSVCGVGRNVSGRVGRWESARWEVENVGRRRGQSWIESSAI